MATLRIPTPHYSTPKFHIPTMPKASTSGLSSLRLPSTNSFTGTTGDFFGQRTSGSSKNQGFYGGGLGGTASTFKPILPPKPSSSGPTTEQVLHLLWLKQHEKSAHHSFLGSILHGATHIAEKGLDIISRPSYALMSGMYDANKSGKAGHFSFGAFAHGLKTGIEGKTKIGFGQILQQHGYLKGHSTIRGLLGAAGDIGTDPVLLVSLGTGAGEAGIAAKAAEMGVAKDVLKKGMEAAAKGTFKDSAAARDAAKMFSKSPDFAAHQALSELHANHLTQIEKGLIPKTLGKTITNRSGLERLAQMETKLIGPSMVRAQFKVPFGKLLYKELPIKAPNMTRIADAQGILGHLPFLPKAAEKVGQAFKPGWREEKAHALSEIARHASTLRQQEALYQVGKHLIGALNEKGLKLSEKEMQKALSVGETARGIVKMRPGRAERVFNNKMAAQLVKAGELSPDQAEFLKAWHNTTEALRKGDTAYGVKYDKPLLGGAPDNVIYVPHLRLSSGESFKKGASVLAKRSFQFPREGGAMALYEHTSKVAPDLAKQLVTDPIELMVRRARSGAIKQSETWMRDLAAATFGHPAYIQDRARFEQLARQHSVLQDKMNQLHTLDPTERAGLYHAAATRVESSRQNALLRARMGHFVETVRRKREIDALKRRVSTAEKRNIPTARQFVEMGGDKFKNRFVKAFAKHPIKGQITRARTIHRSLNALDRSIEKNIKKSLSLKPVTGAAPHGSNYKALMQELIDAANGVLPKAKVDGLKTLQTTPFKRGETWAKRHDTMIESLLSETKDARARNIAQLEEKLSQAFPKASAKGKNTLKSSLTHKQQALERHIANGAQIETKINGKHMLKLQQEHEAIDRLTEKELRIGERLRKAMDKKERQMAHARMPNPNIPEGYKRVDRLRHINGSAVYLPPDIADSLTRANELLNNKDLLAEFNSVLQKNLARWKVAATVANPGYMFRNASSILWNSYISPKGGMPLWAWGRYGGKSANILRDIAKATSKDAKDLTPEDIRALEIHQELAHHGIYMGLYGGDVARAQRALEGEKTAAQLTKAGHPLRGYARGMTTANIQRENWERLTHYLYRRESQGLGRAEAAQIIRDAHFDYGDLTPTEQKLRRSVAPFYTWTRRNIPYQISSMVQRPGKYAAFPLFTNEMNQASPKVPGQIVPGFVKDALGFHVPFGGKGNFILPRLGPEDLTMLEHPKERGSALLSPFIQIPIELATNQRLNSGAPIYGSATSHPRNPISGIAADILSHIPGTDVGQTARRVNGKEVYGPGANPLVSYFAGQTPLTNLLVNSESNVKGAQRGGGGKGLLSWLAGISTYKPDQQSMQVGASALDQQAFKQYMRGLRDMQAYPEAKRSKQSKTDKELQALINRIFGGH